MKIAYIIDSSISLNNEDTLLESNDVFFLPLHIILDGVDYLDDNSLNRKEIINKMIASKNVASSQPSYGECELLLDKIIAKGYDVVVSICLGSGISGTQNLVYGCALDKKLTIVNLDCKGVGPMIAAAIRYFKSLVASGGSLLDIQAKVQHMLDVSNCYAIVDDLMYLKKGGRITSTSAIVGTLLKVKPIVMCTKEQGGKIINIAKERTRKKAYETLIEIALKDINIDEYNIVIGSFSADDYAVALKEVIDTYNPSINAEIVDLSYVIGVHTGPNTVALFTVKK